DESYTRKSRGAGTEDPVRKNSINCTTLLTRIVSLPTQSKPMSQWQNRNGGLLPRSQKRRLQEPSKSRASSIRVIRSDGVNGEVSDPRVSGIRPIFVAALAAAMLPACTQSCDALFSGQQFPIATDLFAHPMPIYWCDRLFSKMHYPSSHAG